MIPKDFIEVTCLCDGKKALVRVDSIVAVYEYGEEKKDYGVKPAHVEIDYDDNKSLDVSESFDDVSTMICNALL